MKVGSRRRSFFGAATVIDESPVNFDFFRPILAVDQRRELFGLLAVAADDGELVLALLAVPDGVFAARSHRDANLADVLRDLVSGHDQHGQTRACGPTTT